MGAENCKVCSGKDKNQVELNNNSAPQQKYGTSGVEPEAPGSRTVAPAAASWGSRNKGLDDPPAALPEPDPMNVDRAGELASPGGTVQSGDVAGGADATAVGITEKGQAGSYSSTYFGREAAELRQLPMPNSGAGETYQKTHTFSTGSTYTGQWKGNQRHGFGVQHWPDGAEYQGQWVENAASGKGKFKHSDSSVYIGQWQNNIAHGHGIYRHKDRTTYEGCFAEDLQDGQGVESWPDKSKFVGQFSKGKKNGYGEYTWPDGSCYAGQWRMNQIDGIGSYLGADERRFNGSWSSSMMHGLGKYEWPDGRAYQGQYVEDQKHGFGIFTWADGRYYEGYWLEGRQHGLGRLYQDGGTTSRLAEWVAGERVRWCDEEDNN